MINKEFSTTKHLYQETPDIVHNSGDKYKTVLFLPKGKIKRKEGGLRTKGYFKKSFKKKPLISIITIVFNGEKYIEKTIRSVIYQNYDNVEYIIIDGLSSDSTLDIIKKYENQIDYWVSEKDKGISDAFNKGIRCSTGEIIAMINADDYYADSNVFKTLISNLNNSEIYFANMKMLYENKKIILKLKSSKNGYKNLLRATFNDLYHPSMFQRKSVFKTMGLFDTNVRLAMDFEFYLRALLCNKKFYYIDKYFSVMRYGGVTNNSIYFSRKEVLKIYRKYVKVNLYYLIRLFSLIKLYIRYKLFKYNLHFILNFYLSLKLFFINKEKNDVEWQ